MKDSSIIIKQNLELRKENIKLKNENEKLRKELKITQNKLNNAYRTIKSLKEKHEKYVAEEEKRIEIIINKVVSQVTNELNKAHEKEINELKSQISRLEKKLNINSSNSGIPTSKDRIGQIKIQNNREKTDGKIGAKKGHKIHKLEYFKEDEITEIVEHKLEKCPKCGGALKELNVVISDIIDIKVIVTKTRNNIHNYKCLCCHDKVTANEKLPRGVTYGENINATILNMMNEANTPLNKISSFFYGISNGEINPTEGYFIKLQKKSTKELNSFIHDLKKQIISLKNVYWDDTTIKFGIGKPEEGYDAKDDNYFEKEELKKKENPEYEEHKVRQGVIRFYGDEKWAYLVGHRYKNKESIDLDCILENLDKECVVMHDHVLLNYNEKYLYKNAECNQHILRYLKGNNELFPEHLWSIQLRDFLIEIKNEKEILLQKNITSFPDDKLKAIYDKYNQIIKLGYEENKKVDLIYILNKTDELNLIERLDKFKENHLMFASDFSVDFTNNTSERGLRTVKRKVAVSFMFKNSNRMKDYAMILSYLETCYRHGISRYDASKRLASGNPFTIEELNDIHKKRDVKFSCF